MGSGLYNLRATGLGFYGINNSTSGVGAYGIANNNEPSALKSMAIERQEMAEQRCLMRARGALGGGIIINNKPSLRDDMIKDVNEYLKDWDK